SRLDGSVIVMIVTAATAATTVAVVVVVLVVVVVMVATATTVAVVVVIIIPIALGRLERETDQTARLGWTQLVARRDFQPLAHGEGQQVHVGLGERPAAARAPAPTVFRAADRHASVVLQVLIGRGRRDLELGGHARFAELVGRE